MRFFNQLKNDMSRSVFSLLFIFSVLVILASLYLSCYTELTSSSDNVSVLYLFMVVFTVGLNYFYMTVSVIPSVIINYQDIESTNMVYVLSRTQRINYFLSKAINAFLSAFLVTFLAFILFAFINLLFFPFAEENISSQISQLYGGLSNIEFIVITIFQKSIYAGFLSLSCLVVLEKIKNIFLLFTLPIIIHYSFSFIFYIVGFPQNLNFTLLSENKGIIGDFNYRFTYLSIYFLIITLIVAVPYIIKTRRKEV